MGFAAIENGRPQAADAGTRYHLGPVSSLFTGALVLQLAEKASITLDTPVAEFFPDLPNALTLTYRDLLAQRSGLADYTRSPGFAEWRNRPHTPGEMLRVITDAGAAFEPRARTEYSASNYLVLGYVLEKIYERPYAELVRRRIADKLGLVRTYHAGAGRFSSLEALGYLPSGAGWALQPQTDPSVAGGATGMYSNATDLARFADALFARKLISDQSVRNLGGIDGEPGLGISRRELGGQIALGTAGAADGFFAAVYYFPDRGFTFACTSNASALPMEPLVDEMLLSLLVRGHRPSMPGAGAPTAGALTHR